MWERKCQRVKMYMGGNQTKEACEVVKSLRREVMVVIERWK